MESSQSQIWSSFNILSQSLKLVARNAILIALTTTLSIFLTSTVFLLFSFLTMTDSSSGLFFVLAFTFMFSYIAIAHALGVTTVTAAAASYTDGGKLSLPDLFSRVRTRWRSPFRFRKNNVRGSMRNPMLFLLFVALAAGPPLVVFYPNPLTIAAAAAVGVSIFVFYLYSSVGSELAAVILVVEDGCEAAEAVEKAEKLVQGQRLQGFVVNVLVNVVGLVVLLSLWMIVGDRGSISLDFTVYGLFFLNCATVMRIFVSVAYTVYYFHCKEYHADKLQLLALVNDIA